MICSYCDKDKLDSSFSLTWQKNNKVCNYCAMFRSISIYGNPDKNKMKKRCCLKCDKDFITNKGNRICADCKDNEEYKIGSTYMGMVHTQV
jgi:hypothetical protein